MLKKIIISIDGPAASGKGKIAKYISKKWKFKHLDSGILYRRVAHELLKKKINFDSQKEIKQIILSKTFISYRNSKKLRAEIVSKIASKIAVYEFVRKYINKFQRDFVKLNKKDKCFVIDGRDIGSVVFKNADLKLYIEVNETNRAKRRYKQLIDTGEKSIYAKILKEIKLRDKKDINRKNSPLIRTKGSIIIDNNHSFEDTKKQLDYHIRNL